MTEFMTILIISAYIDLLIGSYYRYKNIHNRAMIFVIIGFMSLVAATIINMITYDADRQPTFLTMGSDHLVIYITLLIILFNKSLLPKLKK